MSDNISEGEDRGRDSSPAGASAEDNVQQEDETLQDVYLLSQSRLRRNRISPDLVADKARKSTWLITFTDIMALMLTFFVLLHSMSNPDTHKWREISEDLRREFSKMSGAREAQAPLDSLNIQQVRVNRALPLNYLKPLITDHLQEEDAMHEVDIFQNSGRLILSIRQSMSFESGDTQISSTGQEALAAVTGMLSRIENAIEVVGHSDPQPINGITRDGYENNWALSLARAQKVAGYLASEGYRGNIAIKGIADSRFRGGVENTGPNGADDGREGMTESRRFARRVDIVIKAFE